MLSVILTCVGLIASLVMSWLLRVSDGEFICFWPAGLCTALCATTLGLDARAEPILDLMSSSSSKALLMSNTRCSRAPAVVPLSASGRPDGPLLAVTCPGLRGCCWAKSCVSAGLSSGSSCFLSVVSRSRWASSMMSSLGPATRLMFCQSVCSESSCLAKSLPWSGLSFSVTLCYSQLATALSVRWRGDADDSAFGEVADGRLDAIESPGVVGRGRRVLPERGARKAVGCAGERVGERGRLRGAVDLERHRLLGGDFLDFWVSEGYGR